MMKTLEDRAQRAAMMSHLTEWATSFQGQDDRLNAREIVSLCDWLLLQGWQQPRACPRCGSDATAIWGKCYGCHGEWVTGTCARKFIVLTGGSCDENA